MTNKSQNSDHSESTKIVERKVKTGNLRAANYLM